MRTALALILCALAGAAQDAPPAPIPAERLDALLRMVKPQPGEQRFWQLPWKLTITEARQGAAREGKPILVWAGAGGAPIGVC